MIEAIEKILTTDSKKGKPVVLKELENGCIVCTSHKPNSEGYLYLERSGKQIKAHRLVYEHFIGPISEGLCVCHKCDYRACLNPEHFFSGTNTDNMRDMAMKGRAHRPFGHIRNRGEKHGNAKLTDEKVLEIREKFAAGTSQAELVRESGLGSGHVSHIVNNKIWKHLNNSMQVLEPRR